MGAKGARVAAPRPEGKGGDESGGFSRKRFFSSPIEHRRPTTSGPDRYSKRVATALSSPRCLLACKLCFVGQGEVEEVKYKRVRAPCQGLAGATTGKNDRHLGERGRSDVFRVVDRWLGKKGREVLLSVRASARYR